MKAFAELLERLLFSPGRNTKIALLHAYFASRPDPERGYALAAIAGVFYGRAWRAERRVGASAMTHAMVDTVWSIWLR